MPEIRPGVKRLIRLATRRPDEVGAEVDEEIRLHLELRAAQLAQRGLPPDEARAEAERRFGPAGSLTEAQRRLHASARRREDRMRTREWLHNLGQDLRVALRGLRRAPGLVAAAVLCLALGVGANAAVYSLVEQVLLRPVPVAAPERLVNLGAPGPKPGPQACTQAGGCDATFSHPMFRDLERAERTRAAFAGVAAHALFEANLSLGRRAAGGEGLLVSGSYFPVLGLRPAVGRLLGPADDQSVGGHPVAVLSHGYWETQFGADPGVVGSALLVNGQPMIVVGVAPRGFAGTTLGARPQVFVPLAMRGVVSPGAGGFDDRRNYWLYLFARLRPGVATAAARTAAQAVYAPILAGVEAPLQAGMSAPTLAQFRAKRITLEDGRRGQSVIHREVRAPLLLLLAISAAVLLIACANVANLLLVRGAGRGAEVAVRLSLGATRGRVVRQLLAESGVLAGLGGAVGLGVAWGALALAGPLLPPEAAGAVELGVRWPVALFAAALALATALLAGLYPAVRGSRPDLVAAVRAGAGGVVGGRGELRAGAALVTAQIALSTVLLVAAGLLGKSLARVSRVDLGLAPAGVVTFAVSPGRNGYEPARSKALFARLEAELAALPGVRGAAAARFPLLTGGNWSRGVSVEGFRPGPDADVTARFNEVGPDYLRTLGIPLLAGRGFTAADREGAPKVVVVNEAFARKFGLGRAAVGMRLGFGDGPRDAEIVGVVRDAKYSEVKGDVPPLVLRPYAQGKRIGAMTFYVRAAGDAEPLLRGVPRVVAGLDPALPVEALKPLPQQVRENVALDRTTGALAAAFAALATLLAAVGLSGVLAYAVARRAREIGVRMALGADGRRVRALVLGQVGRLVLAGGTLGVVAALGVGRALGSLLYGVDGHDPAVVAGAVAVLAAAALVAGYVPARRAARLDPLRALRPG